MALPTDVLRRSPEEGARRIALERLAEARAACERLQQSGDPRALHAFRVALRRLGSTLRAWRPELGRAARRRRRRALGALQAASGGPRDTDVALAWLAGQREGLSRDQRPGHDWLVGRLEARRREALTVFQDGLPARFASLEAKLRPRLARLRLELRLLEPETRPDFGEVLAARSRQSAARLARLLDDIASPEDRKRSHGARIGCKRLRYLLEPLRPRLPEAVEIVARCRRLQDVLGELQDAFVLQDEVAAALEELSVAHTRRLLDLARHEDPSRLERGAGQPERPGLLELARRLGVRVRLAFEELEKDWLGAGTRRLVEAVEQMAQRLEAGGGELEIERKYLLRGLPSLPAEVRTLQVEQGWLPGERLRERLRRVRRPDGSLRHQRALKLGRGLRRVEIEEDTSREVFQVLWPLTDGCRIRKLRHVVREGSRVWEIDEFQDRSLVLAEVELSDSDERPELPPWLAAHVVREVTDDPRFTNLALARHPGRVPEGE